MRVWSLFALMIVACVPAAEQLSPRNDAGMGVDAQIKLDAAPPKATLVPTTQPELDYFLLEQRYLDFPSESGIHQSEGPHFGKVITFMNPLLVASLQAGNREHPQGANTRKAPLRSKNFTKAGKH